MPPPLPPAIGRYEVRERIGQGGMGALFLALDPAIDRLVALKLLRVDSDEMRARFLREARSAGRLHHPYIVTVYDVGEHEGQPFIAMEYVRGETLSALVRRRAPLTLTNRLQLIEYLCEGLQYAHDAGLVHRDIKPANQAARQAVERARQQFADGDHRAAFSRLEKLVSTHPIAAQALAELRREAEAIEREQQSGETARKRLEAWVTDQLDAVRQAIRDGLWDEAAAQVEELRARSPRTPELPALTAEVERGRLDARRLSEVEEFLSEARRRKTSEDFPAALSRVDAALALLPDHAEAIALREEIEELAAAIEQRHEAEAALRAGRFREALKALSEVDQEVATATQGVRFRTLSAEAQERRRKARKERAARRQQRLKQARTRVDQLARTGLSRTQQAIGDRRLQPGRRGRGGACLAVGTNRSARRSE